MLISFQILPSLIVCYYFFTNASFASPNVSTCFSIPKNVFLGLRAAIPVVPYPSWGQYDLIATVIFEVRYKRYSSNRSTISKILPVRKLLRIRELSCTCMFSLLYYCIQEDNFRIGTIKFFFSVTTVFQLL